MGHQMHYLHNAVKQGARSDKLMLAQDEQGVVVGAQARDLIGNKKYEVYARQVNSSVNVYASN